MWKSLISVLLIGLHGLVLATGNQPSTPPSSQASSSSASKSHSTSRSFSGASSSSQSHSGDSNSQSKSTGGRSSNQLDLQGGSYDNGDSFFIALPAPAFTPPLPPLPATSCVRTVQSSRGALWNGFNTADAEQDPRWCVAVGIYNAHIEMCRYASAKQALDLLTVQVLPGFVNTKQDLLDLTPNECAALKAPVVKKEVVYMLPEPPKAKVKRVAPVVDPCISQCKKPRAKLS